MDNLNQEKRRKILCGLFGYGEYGKDRIAEEDGAEYWELDRKFKKALSTISHASIKNLSMVDVSKKKFEIFTAAKNYSLIETSDGDLLVWKHNAKYGIKIPEEYYKNFIKPEK